MAAAAAAAATEAGRPSAASTTEKKQQGCRKAAENKGGRNEKQQKGRRLLLSSVAAADDANSSERPRQQPTLGELHPGAEQPPASSYSAAILSALRAESSTAARAAVKQLKAAVMQHNTAVAAGFMAETKGQHSWQEQEEDAAKWRMRLADR